MFKSTAGDRRSILKSVDLLTSLPCSQANLFTSLLFKSSFSKNQYHIQNLWYTRYPIDTSPRYVLRHINSPLNEVSQGTTRISRKYWALDRIAVSWMTVDEILDEEPEFLEKVACHHFGNQFTGWLSLIISLSFSKKGSCLQIWLRQI